ncbi:hypothetical protein B0A77_08990 [Flavobacterium branchiophilum]|uniref:Uncharacterized protein n=2 Tax=Flavobacterium branchiophilum TaxID=55197 RepID=A0A2H3KXE2_9FLAO|nr:hypothetical protein B0A77_08990 [Flavobacterium branchiophilum]
MNGGSGKFDEAVSSAAEETKNVNTSVRWTCIAGSALMAEKFDTAGMLGSSIQYGWGNSLNKTANAAKGVGKALNGVDDVLANPNLLQGKSLEQVQSVLGNSKNWVNDVMRKSTRADGWVLREMNQAGTDFTGRMIQYHPGTPRHFGGAPYWKVSAGNGGPPIRIPLNP